MWSVQFRRDLATYAQPLMDLLQAPRAFDLYIHFLAEDQLVDPVPSFADVTSIADSSLRLEQAVHPLFMHVPILTGPPKWKELFAEQQSILSHRGELRTAVFAASSLETLIEIVRVTTSLNGTGLTQFIVETEEDQSY
jgi:hypothetical protein